MTDRSKALKCISYSVRTSRYTLPFLPDKGASLHWSAICNLIWSGLNLTSEVGCLKARLDVRGSVSMRQYFSTDS